jgi:hypothetical protein
VPLTEKPSAAKSIIAFAGSAGTASKLDYDVPMPGALRGRRLLELAGLVADADWLATATDKTFDPVNDIDLKPAGNGTYVYSREKAIELWLRAARANGVSGDRVAELERWLASPQSAGNSG